jgi:hypothetical protein
MAVELIKCQGSPISIGYGKFCFSIVNRQVADNMASRLGCQTNGNLSEYEKAFELCRFAWEHQMFDVEHNR